MTSDPRKPADEDADNELPEIDFSAVMFGDDDDDDDDDGFNVFDDDDKMPAPSAAARHTAEPSIYTPNQLLPPELSDLDLGAYDIIQVEARGGVERFLGLYLPNTRDAFTATGVGVYECILRFPFKRAVNDEDVKQYMSRCRSMLSRLRQASPDAAFFFMVLVQYEILPDRKHVAMSVARMAQKNYSVWASEQKQVRDKMRNTIEGLKGLL